MEEKRKKCTILLVSALAVLLLCVVAVLLLSSFPLFQPMPGNAFIREIDVDDHQLVFFLTAQNELYVGGDHDDFYGVYCTGFRWNAMYRLRRHFIRDDAPVLLATNVADLFPCMDGVLYTDVDGTLYYFGSTAANKDRGKPVVIAEDVQSAACSNEMIVYATQSGSVFQRTWASSDQKWGAALLLAEDVIQVYTDGFTVQAIGADHTYFTMDAGDRVETDYKALPGKTVLLNDIERMWNTDTIHIFQSKDGGLWYARTVKHHPKPLDVLLDFDIKLADVNSMALPVFVSTKNEMFTVSFHKNEVDVLRRVEYAGEKTIVDIAEGRGFLYIVFSDGSYQKIEINN